MPFDSLPSLLHTLSTDPVGTLLLIALLDALARAR